MKFVFIIAKVYQKLPALLTEQAYYRNQSAVMKRPDFKKYSKDYCSVISKGTIKDRIDELESEELMEGYYKFLEAKSAHPPKVKPPPYLKSSLPCDATKSSSSLCGDLNKGVIPDNPMHHDFDGMPYPFELITNKTLEFLSRTLPILQTDETVPKVINYNSEDLNFYFPMESKRPMNRIRRDTNTFENTLVALKDFLLESTDIMNITKRARKYCETGNGMICLLYKAIQGESLPVEAQERKEEVPISMEEPSSIDGPPTPCPAKIEYATPVFARNYQGIWRYVVQIPYEGYFTQTVEVTKCLNTRCHYIDGKCLSSPRWVSLLAAEIYYPDGFKETSGLRDDYHYSGNSTKMNDHCDGVDKNGCFQVRLYYDWFLVPGSCKCWRPEYLYKYMNLK